MHLIEKYALDCGINPAFLSKPEIFASFVPLGENEIITISTTTEGSAPYPYFQDVVDELISTFEKEGVNIQIIQLGGADDQIIEGCKVLNGSLTLSQLTYVLSKSMLHIGNMSSHITLCSALNAETKTVGVYHGDSFKTLGPYWNAHRHIQVKWDEKTPNPEEIIGHVKDSLAFYEGDSMKTVYLGEKYPRPTFDIVPDLAVGPEFMNGAAINIRFDFLEVITEENIKNAIISSMKRPTILVSDRVFDLSLLREHRTKTKVGAFLFSLKKESIGDEKVLDFCSQILKMGLKLIPVVIKANLTPKEISQFKLDFLDLCPIQEVDETSFKELDESKLTGETIFKSSRLIFSEKKMYLSKQAFLEKAPVVGQRWQKLSEIKDWSSLGKELEYSYIFNKENL